MSDLTLEDFKKTQLRAAKILDAQEIPGADRLWRVDIDLGAEKKTVVAGIKKFYSREELLGKMVVVVTNLVPSIIRGVESQGMLLAAKDGDKLTLLTLDKEISAGCPIG